MGLKEEIQIGLIIRMVPTLVNVCQSGTRF